MRARDLGDGTRARFPINDAVVDGEQDEHAACRTQVFVPHDQLNCDHSFSPKLLVGINFYKSSAQQFLPKFISSPEVSILNSNTVGSSGLVAARGF